MRKLFISGKLNGPKYKEVNKKLALLLHNEGCEIYLPQEKLPRKMCRNCKIILERNEKAIEDSDIVLVIFDNMDMGVAMEAEFAYARGKVIVGYRAKFNKHLGSMVEGFWNRIDRRLKVTKIEDIKKALRLTTQVS